MNLNYKREKGRDQYHWDIGKRYWVVKSAGDDIFRQSIWLLGCDSLEGRKKIERYMQDHVGQGSSNMEIV